MYNLLINMKRGNEGEGIYLNKKVTSVHFLFRKFCCSTIFMQ